MCRALEAAPGLLVAQNNRAMAHLKLQQWGPAEADCTAVLAAEPHNVKALWRRALARWEDLPFWPCTGALQLLSVGPYLCRMQLAASACIVFLALQSASGFAVTHGILSSVLCLYCREGLRQPEAAVSDLKALLELQPSNKEAAAKLQQLQGAAAGGGAAAGAAP